MNNSVAVPLPQDKAIVGHWVETSTGVVADQTCRRIEALIEHHFKHVAEHPEEGGWRALFRDPQDGRLWERTYPEGHMHGGGPPMLRLIDAEEAKVKFRL